ncbi:site-specific integrase [Bacteroidota bacterium]
MRASSTFNILIWINRSRLKNNEAEIFARITVNQKRANISLKRKVDLSNWDSARACVKGNGERARLTNRYIEQTKNDIFVAYQELKQENKIITSQSVKSRYLGLDNIQYSLLDMFEYHNTKMGPKLNAVTLRHYKTSQNYMLKFILKEYKVKNMFLNELKYSFLIGFEYFLLNHKPQGNLKPIKNNTVMKHIQRLRKMTTMAYKMEWIDKDPFIRFKSRYEKSEREFLTQKELERIEEYIPGSNRLKFVRDLFVFSCYTGIAYMDIMLLTKNNLLLGIDGNKWIITKRHKTGTPVKVPLLRQAKELIEDYSDNQKALSTGTLFPKMSNQKLNDYLKELAALCDITKHLTFHMARHTFATTVTLTNGVPIETVSKMLGHTKLSTTQIYAKVVETKVSEDMNKLRDLLDGKTPKNEADSRINIY